MTFFFSSVILFLQYTANLGDSFRIVRWLMGGLGSTGWGSLLSMAPLVTVGAVVVALLARDLDLLSVGSEIAAGRGVDVVANAARSCSSGRRSWLPESSPFAVRSGSSA